jgi:hypothetical protein
MRLLGRKVYWRRPARRVCAGVALVAYLLAAIGFPVPASAAKSAGAPFPCQNHACGCRTAEQCWRSCCCLTAEERWAWAREHHVEPPPYAERPAPPKPPPPAAPKGWQTTRLRDQAQGRIAAAPACAECARRAEEAKRAAATRRPCCADKERPAQPAPADGLRWVGGAAALGCRGVKSVWIAAGAVIPPPAAPAWEPYTPPAEWLSLSSDNPLGPSLVPPDPPPRCTHS